MWHALGVWKKDCAIKVKTMRIRILSGHGTLFNERMVFWMEELQQKLLSIFFLIHNFYEFVC